MNSFYNWLKVLAALNSLSNRLATQEKKMADFQTDVNKLTADVAADTALVTQVQALQTANAQSIADLKAQIAVLQAGGAVDTTGLEAAIASLETANTTLGTLVTPATPPATS